MRDDDNSESKWSGLLNRKIVVGAAAAAGLFGASVFVHPPTAEAAVRQSLAERVQEAREVLDRQTEAHEGVPDGVPGGITQWFNRWANLWNNWGNWSNWRNWHNWGNSGGWLNGGW